MGRLGLPEGLPFLMDRGRPVAYANRWLASLADTGCDSPQTWSGYATDFKAYYQFLRDERGEDPLSADRSDWGAYSSARRITGHGQWTLLADSSWGRQLAALERFYGWALEEGLRTDTPFRYAPMKAVPREDGGFRVVRRNLAAAKRPKAHVTIKWLEPSELRLFLQVGLGGLLPNGREDPAFRGRYATRNRAFGTFSGWQRRAC